MLKINAMVVEVAVNLIGYGGKLRHPMAHGRDWASLRNCYL